MPLSDQRRSSICHDAVHDIFLAVAEQQICQLCCVHAGTRIEIQARQVQPRAREDGEHDFILHFACYREKGDATTVATFCSVTLLLVCKNDVGIFSLLREALSGSAVRKKMMQPSVQSTATIHNDLS